MRNGQLSMKAAEAQLNGENQWQKIGGSKSNRS
jgi:hypothetical protein